VSGYKGAARSMVAQAIRELLAYALDRKLSDKPAAKEQP
jgi:hypothetical protein